MDTGFENESLNYLLDSSGELCTSKQGIMINYVLSFEKQQVAKYESSTTIVYFIFKSNFSDIY